MARNQEKAQAMLNRLLTSKQQEAKGPREKRPYLATECHDVNEADRWRQQILREIGRKVMEIQNAGLGEHRHASRHRLACRLCLCSAAPGCLFGEEPHFQGIVSAVYQMRLFAPCACYSSRHTASRKDLRTATAEHTVCSGAGYAT